MMPFWVHFEVFKPKYGIIEVILVKHLSSIFCLIRCKEIIMREFSSYEIAFQLPFSIVFDMDKDNQFLTTF